MNIKYEVKVTPDDTPFVGNCSAVDADVDRETEQWIREQLNAGNDLAWCCVEVQATLEFEGQTFMGRDYLGGVSCKDQKDLEEVVDTHQMRETARLDLLNYLNNEVKRGHIARKAIMMLAKGDMSK